jgi:glucose-6-phosphate isomerase
VRHGRLVARPEVICGAAGVDLDVLDSSDPDFVRAAIERRPGAHGVVVSSKSGGTVETDSQRRAYEKAFADAGIDARERIVVVTDPGSPLDASASEVGYRVFRADPSVGGRFSALTAFGLVPSAWPAPTSAPCSTRPRPSARRSSRLGRQPGSAPGRPDRRRQPGRRRQARALQRGGAVRRLRRLGRAAHRGVEPARTARACCPSSSSRPPPRTSPPAAPTRCSASFGPGWLFDDVRTKSGWGVSVDAPLGAQMLLWEHATAVAGAIIGINPFDQPDVESAKAASRRLLDGGGADPEPRFTDGAITVYASPGWLPDDVDNVHDAITELLAGLDLETGYVAVQAYLDRHRDAALADVRTTIASATERPVTFGWGPRFLHSTGQYHKGGPSTGVYLQVTGQPERDLAVPDRPFTFHEFLIAQAVGDGQVLAEKGRPVLRLHLDGPGSLDAVRQALL